MPNRSKLWPTKPSAERLALALIATLAAACGDAQHRIGNAPGGLEDLDGNGDRESLVGRCDWDADIEIIDDMEDGQYAFDAHGRIGTWFPFNDESEGAVQEPRPNATLFPIAELDPPRDHSERGVHTFGSGFMRWGGGVGLDLLQKREYDAERYAGLVFFARTERGELLLRAEVTDVHTSPLGGECVELPPDVAPSEDEFACFANYGREVQLTEEWRAFVIEWDDMTPKFDADKAKALDTSALYAVQFQTNDGTSEFDFYVDDVAFLCARR